MTEISKTPLPQMNIKKIFVNKDNIVVNGILTSQDQSESPFWMDEEYFTEFIDVYFIVENNHGFAPNIIPSKLSDPKSRVQNILDSLPGSVSEQWDRELLRDNDFRKVSLKDLTEGEADLIVTTSAIQSSSPAAAGSLKDIAFSIRIDLTPNTNLDPATDNSRDGPSDVILHAFTHLNFLGLMQEYNLNSLEDSFARLQEIGGNYVVEKLLEVASNEDGENVYRVPQATSMLVYQDGTPFHGSYHHHLPPNIGPNGEEWMEGPRNPMHPDARWLREVQIPYTKVVANFLLDDDFFEGIGFDGSVEPMTSLPFSHAYDPETNRERALARFLDADARSADPNGIPIISSVLHYSGRHLLTGELGAHTIFKLNFGELIKTRSRYPLFWKRFSSWFEESDETYQRAHRVQEFKITRFRLSNETRSNNAVGSADYDRYSNEDLEETIILTSQSPFADYTIPQFPGGYDYGNNNIGRMYPIDTQDSGLLYNTRTYVLLDKDLAKMNFGKYGYNIYLKVQDAMKDVFMKKVEQFRNYIEGPLSTFLVRASTSRIRYDEDTGLSLGYVDGYDFNKEEYTDAFISMSRISFDSQLEGMIDMFIRLQGLLGVFDNPASSSSTDARILLEKQIIPAQGGTYEGVLQFSKHCDHLLRTYEDILNKDSTFDTGLDPSGTKTVLGQRHSPDKNMKIIDFKARIPGYNEAYMEGDVFVEYDLSDLRSMAGELAVAPSRFSYAHDIEEIREIINVRDWNNLPEEIAERHAAMLEDMLRTPQSMTGGQVLGILEDMPTHLPEFGIPGLSYDFGSAGHKNISADVNTKLGDLESLEMKSPLGKVGNAAVKTSVGNYSDNKSYKLNKAKHEAQKKSFYRSKIFSALSSKIAKSSSTKTKNEGIIKSKTKKILVQQGNSALASFVPLTAELLKKLGNPSDTVLVKIDDNVGKSEGLYKVIQTPTMMTISQLRQLVGESLTSGNLTSASTSSTATAPETEGTASRSSTTTTQSSARAITRAVTRTTTGRGGY